MSTLSNWFERGHVPPGEDDLHTKAVTIGIVPHTCLQGGAAIWTFHDKGIDICQLCHWKRELCGGRPMRSDGVITTKYDHIQADDSPGAAKGLVFAKWLRDVKEQLASGPQDRKRSTNPKGGTE